MTAKRLGDIFVCPEQKSTTQLPGSFRRQLENSQLSPPFMQLGKAIFDGSLRALDQKQAVPPERNNFV